MGKKVKIYSVFILTITIVIIAVVGINLSNQNKEKQRIKEMKLGFKAKNLLGLWNVEGENFNLLFYIDRESKVHIRSNFNFDANSNNDMIDSIVTDDNGTGVISCSENFRGNVSISLTIIDEVANASENSRTVTLSFYDDNNNSKTLFFKDVKITRSQNNSLLEDENQLGIIIADLIKAKVKEVTGETVLPIVTKLDETNTYNRFIEYGELSGTVTASYDNQTSTNGYFNIDVTTTPFTVRELRLGDTNIVHVYKNQ